MKTLVQTLSAVALALGTALTPCGLNAAPLSRSALVLKDDPSSWGQRLDVLMQGAASQPAAKPAETFEAAKQPKTVVSAVTQTAVVVAPAPTPAAAASPAVRQQAAVTQRGATPATDDRSWLQRFQSWIMSVARSMQ